MQPWGVVVSWAAGTAAVEGARGSGDMLPSKSSEEAKGSWPDTGDDTGEVLPCSDTIDEDDEVTRRAYSPRYAVRSECGQSLVLAWSEQNEAEHLQHDGDLASSGG
jgi:hypothetical protein